MNAPDDNLLGAYLRDRRTKLDPAALGLHAKRRRTRGLRREEVAQLADVNATWYAWLEHGRGGPPSADAIELRALALTPAEREYIFLLAQNRPPKVSTKSQRQSPHACNMFLTRWNSVWHKPIRYSELKSAIDAALAR